jgi:hypothetical protein
MTEEEAKQKWCPFVREATLSDLPAAQWVATNRHEKSFPKCAASKCMMWVKSLNEDGRGVCGLAGSNQSF